MKPFRFLIVILLFALIACGRAPAPEPADRPALTQPARSPTSTLTTQPTPPSDHVPSPTLPPTRTPRPTRAPLPTTAPPTQTPTTAPPTQTPTTTTQPTPAPIQAGAGQRFIAHIVTEGETLADLARYGMPAEHIMRYNHLKDESLRPGMPLLILTDDPDAVSTPVLVERGNPAQARVAITLDAGASSAPTPQILAALRERHLRVTFFLTGAWMRDNPDLTRQIVADGHELANHSFHHPDFRTLDRDQMLHELEATEQIAREIAGVSTRPYFRPPYGGIDRRVIEVVIAAGYVPIYWSLDSLDSVGEPKSADFLFERVTSRLSGDAANGAIVLMHCGSQPTADALPRILDHFAARGVQVTTISEVLGP